MAVVINEFETLLEPAAPSAGHPPAPAPTAASAPPLAPEDLRLLLAELEEALLRVQAH